MKCTIGKVLQICRNKFTKPPECVDIGLIRRTSRGFQARVRRTSAFRAPAGKTE